MAYGVYECKWYNMSAKNAKDLMFIVYRSAISLKLTAGKFGNFSLELFGIVRYICTKENILLYMQYRYTKLSNSIFVLH